MCTIEDLFVTMSPVGPQQVTVTGRARDCAADPIDTRQITVDLICPGGTQTRQATVFDDGRWTVVFPNRHCECDAPVRVVATCSTDPNCSETLDVEELECIECPRIAMGNDDADPNYVIDCLPSGRARVTFEIDVVNDTGDVVCLQPDFGPMATNAGPLSVCFTPTPNLPQTTFSAEYPTPFAPEIVLWITNQDGSPRGCPPFIMPDLVLDPCPNCPPLPEIGTEVQGCTVTLTGSLPPGCVLYIDFGDPSVPNPNDSADQTTVNSLPASYTYDQNGTMLISVTMICEGTCLRMDAFEVEVTDCLACPSVEIEVTAEDCEDGRRVMRFDAVATGAQPTSFAWTLNGSPTPETGASTSREFDIGDTVDTEVVASGPGTCETTAATSTTVDDCGGCCPPWAIPLMIALAFGAYVLEFALWYCLGVSIPPWALLAPVVAVLATIVLCFLICKWAGCKCPTFDRCFLLLTAWYSALVGFFTALYIGPTGLCISGMPGDWLCPIGCCAGKWWWWAIIAAFFASYLWAFYKWKDECNPTTCVMWKRLAFILVSIMGSLFAYLGLIPVITACAWKFVPLAAALWAALATIKVDQHCN